MKQVTLTISDEDVPGFLRAIAEQGLMADLQIKSLGPENTKRKVHRGPSGQSTLSTIMSHYSFGAKFSPETAAGWLEKAGYSPTSVSPALARLRQTGFLERHGNKEMFKKPWSLQEYRDAMEDRKKEG